MCSFRHKLSVFVKVIEKYLQSTHAPTHTDYTMTILDIFAVEKEGEKDNFCSEMENKYQTTFLSYTLSLTLCSM